MTSASTSAWCLRSRDGRDHLGAEAPQVCGVGVDVHDDVVYPAVAPLPQTVGLEARRPPVPRDLLAPQVLRVERGDLDLVESAADPIAFGAVSGYPSAGIVAVTPATARTSSAL
jgi:hypothetical protein